MRRREETGNVLVEAAFVLPLLMFFVLGLIDLGFWNFHNSQVSHGARDGARKSTLAFAGADTAGSPNNLKVRDAIAARLAGQAFTFTVQCLPPTGTTVKACSTSTVSVDRDRIRVAVTWTRPVRTFVSQMIGASTTVSSKSTMTIVGDPI